MGADNSANTCRRITETVRDAGINGITLPRDEVVILTINRQNNFTFQYSAYFLTLMLNSFPSGCARLVRFKDHRQRAIRYRYEPASLTHPDYPSQLSRPD